jgi:sialate O-acetylesterase
VIRFALARHWLHMTLPAPLLRAAFLATLAAPAFADVSLPAIFSDHAVLQKSPKVPVWGTADAGEKVVVTLGPTSARTVAGPDGKWRVSLDLTPSGTGPFTLTVQGKNTLTASDVLVGEVWLASGQSNMEWLLRNSSGAASEIQASANPQLRHFALTKAEAASPIAGYRGKWIVSSPETSGAFTAVGYHFSKTLQQTLNAPVGLIHASWGGTPIETWTGKEALAADPDLAAGAEKADADLRTYSRRLRVFTLGYFAWQEAHKRQDRAFSGVPSDDGWQPAYFPGKLGDSGAAWLRYVVEVPDELAGKPVVLPLTEGLRGTEQVYWNGALVGSTSLEQAIKTRGDRRHTVPADQVKAGRATVAIRIFNATDDIVLPVAVNLGKLRATGGWERKTEFTFPALSSEAKAALPENPGRESFTWQGPSRLFNAMIHPLIPYAIKGAIWYQGENNVPRAYQYRKAFPLLIADWRARWGQGDFAFYFCQLANMNAKGANPSESNWAELREAQSLTLSTPNTGQAVLIDIGDSANIHPTNKKDAGERLAALALAQTYGQKIAFSGPAYAGMKIEGAKIRLAFKHTDGDLVARPLPATYSVDSATGATAPLVRNSTGPLEGFAICGADRKWVWAEAVIEGDHIVVSSAQVPAPVAVRYGWANNPTVNLYNGAGFPASPFRTDDFPITSQSARY